MSHSLFGGIELIDSDKRLVLIVVANVKQFRVPFYSLLERHLEDRGIILRVAYSDPEAGEALKGDSVDLPPPLGVKVRSFHAFEGKALLQAVPLRELLQADIVILIQASGYLLNYPLLLAAATGLKRVALWGHGRNRQGNPKSLSELWKRKVSRYASWWFAYTEETARYIAAIGYPRERITAVQNSVDTRSFKAMIESVSADELREVRQEFGLHESDRVCLYCGSLYREKMLSYLLDAADLIKEQLPNFKLIIIGGGGQADLVRTRAGKGGTVYVGALFGRRKAAFFKLAELFLCPGLVGLAILDSFAAGLPLLTTTSALHSPEIDYLQDGINGRLVEGGAEAFAREVVRLLFSPAELAKMRTNAYCSAERYTIEAMSRNFGDGIVRAIGAQ